MTPQKAIRQLSEKRGAPCTALVTGATSGMGLEYARQLAALGCNVVAVSNQQDRLHAVATEIERQFGVRCATLYKDLATISAAQEVFDFCQEINVEVDILINNAGMFFFEELNPGNSAKALAMLHLHVETPMRLMMLFGEAMKKRGYGYMLTMSSMAAKIPAPGITVYSATKAYLRSFTKSLFFEMRPYGVGVTAVCPGAVATPLYNLSERYQRIAIRLGIMRTPQKLVKSALKALFRRRRCVTPGFVNHIAPACVNALPHWAVTKIWNKVR